MAKLPLEGEKTLTTRTGSLDDVATRGADLKIVGEVCLARRAGATFRQVRKPRLFFDLLLIFLGERPARAYQQIDEEATEKAERHQNGGKALEPAISETRTTIMPGPDGQADPETEHKHQGTSSQQACQCDPDEKIRRTI